MFGPTWSEGDIIGCGISKLGIFFTLNGLWVADAPSQVENGVLDYARCKEWFPAFSSSHPASVAFNFRGSFAYTISRGLAPFLQERRVLPPRSTLFAMTFQKEFALNKPHLRRGGRQIEFPTFSSPLGLSLQSSVPLIFCQEQARAIMRGFFYFEVTVLSAPHANNSFLSLGLATKPYPAYHHIGWNRNSIGYHR